MATEVGNIHIGLYVDVGESRRFTDVANLVERDSRRMNSALGNTTNSVRALRSQMNQNLRFRIAQDSLKGLTQATNEVSRLRAAMLGLAAITGTGVTGAFSAAYLVQTADKARLLGNQIRTVTSDSAEFGSVQEALFQVSQRTRSSLEATTQIYARTARATDKFGYSQEKLLKITETVQKAFAIGGATPQEATGAALQLSQGIASDRFGGDEFRSVAENAPVLLRGIAESIGVTVAKLREMSKEGKLTAQTVTDAIVGAGDRIDKEFAKTLPTVAQSFTLVDNAFTKYIGEADSSYGFTKALSTGIKGLADNFEDVMYWITRAGGALAAFYASRKLFMGTRNKILDVKATNAGIREEIADRVEENQKMATRLIAIEKEIEAARTRAQQAGGNAEAARVGRYGAAQQKEVEAVKRVNALQAERSSIVDRLQRAQQAEASTLRQQVETARQRVRDDQLRVIQAQEAAAAEERNLAARRAQALAKQDTVIDKANGRVFDTLGRAGAAASAIQAEKDLAKVRLAGEVDTRRQSLVTQTMRLKQIQDQVAELRQVKDLPGFDKSFGGQYRSLLKQQQDAIGTTTALRKQLSDLDKQMSGLDDGSVATKGMTAAMGKHAEAVKRAEAAVKSLADAEMKRAQIAAAPVSGKTMDARVASEAKELERYQKSVDSLQEKMRALRQATESAFSGAGVRKVTAELDAFDKKIATAQDNLKKATAATVLAQADGGEVWAASLEAQARASKEVNALSMEANAILERQVVTTSRIAAAQKSLNVLRRVGGNVLDFFGGWTGIAITGALVAATALMAKFAAESQKSAEETERITKQLTDLGYLTTQAADEMGRFQDNVAKGRISRLQTELNDFQKEVDKTVDAVKGIDIPGDVSEKIVKMPTIKPGTSSFEANRITTEWMKASKAAVNSVSGDLQRIRDEMVKNKSMSEDNRKALEDMALAKPELATIILSLVTMGERMNGLRDATKDWTDSLRKAREEAQKYERDSSGNLTGQAQMLKASNSRTASAKAMEKYAGDVTQVVTPEINESALSEYDSSIRRIMDGLIKQADKLGKTMLDSDARRAAEIIYANDVSKKGLRDLIGFYEGTDKGRGYNETLDYGKYTGGDVNLTQMSLNEVISLQKKMLADPSNDKNSSAVGRYQITMTTLLGLMKNLGISGNTTFSKELQDRLADELIRESGGNAGKLRSTWVGLQRATDDQIKSGSTQSLETLPRMDESAQQWLDSMKDLNLKNQIASLKEFDQTVLQTAESMGATKEELQQYINAANSGDMTQIPERFKQIVAAMQEAKDVDLAKQWTELRSTNLLPFLSDANQKVVEVARSLGIAEDQIRSFIQATLEGKQVPGVFQAIQAEVEKVTANDRLVKFADGAAEAFGDMFNDIAHGDDVFKNLLKRLSDLVLQIFVIEPLVESLKSSFRGLASGAAGSGGGSGGGLLGGLLKLIGFDSGGWTGPGGKKDPAGIVHGDEFVFSKEAVNNAGVGQLNMLHELLKTGRVNNMRLPGYMDGGFVGSMPSFDMGGYVSPDATSSRMAGDLRQNEGGVRVQSDVVVRMEDDEKFHAYVERTSTVAADRRVKHYDANLPGRIEAINRAPRKRTNPT